MNDNSNRMGELALELFGAKATSEFFKQAWESAPPETRQQVAEKLIDTIAHALPDSFTIRSAVESAISKSLYEEAKRQVKAREEENANRIAAAVEEALGHKIKELAEGAVRAAIGDVMEAFRRRFSLR